MNRKEFKKTNKPMKKVITIALVAILFFSCSTNKEVIRTEKDLDNKLQNVLKYKRVTGFSVSIFTKDEVLYQNAYGYSDINSKSPYITDSKQLIASISKTTIAVALMKAQEMGLLSLDDPINNHLPFEVINPHFRDEQITIRHLAKHTSSLKYSEQMTDFRAFENPEMNLRSFVEAYVSKDGKWYSPENFHKEKPGIEGDYSNVGASLAAYIVEYKSGMPFSAFTEKYIFEPLGLNRTSFQGESDVSYYKYISQDNFEKVERKEGDGLYPAGRLSTNVKELTKFCQMVMGKGVYNQIKVLEEASVEEMLKSKKLKRSLDDEINKQAVFWSTLKNPLGIPKEMIGHNGGDYGIYTMMFFDQKTGVGYILLSNTGMTEDNHVAMHQVYKSLWEYSKNF